MPANRIPTLDGWRGIAVLLVLALHLQMNFYHAFMRYPWTWVGEHGVTIFFVVSGFLITTNLLHNPDLKRFYARRFLRLMPAAWVFLAVLWLLSLTHLVTAPADSTLGCLFFYRNFLDTQHAGTYTGHFWSLSVEEQFYFVWPMVLLVSGRRIAPWIAGVGAVSVAVYRAIFHPHVMAQGYAPIFGTELRIDAVMVGCVLAFVMSDGRARQWITAHSAWIFWGCAPVLAFDFWRYQAIPPLHENVAIAMMVSATVTNPRLLASKVLEMPHLKTTGMLCYGIYLWQGLLLRAVFGPFAFVLLPLAVACSWVFVEKPAMRFGSRVATAAPILVPAPDPAQ
jgi:peptidoglycan/LPS O-acetylase OafA/YrhL